MTAPQIIVQGHVLIFGDDQSAFGDPGTLTA